MVLRSTRLLISAALIAFVSTLPAGAQLWPFGEAAKAQRAFDEGRLGEALARYRVILEAHTENDAQRGDAMWHVALIRLGAQDPTLRDVEDGCRTLDEFAEAYKSSPHDVELRALRGLCALAEGREPDYGSPAATEVPTSERVETVETGHRAAKRSGPAATGVGPGTA